MPKLYQYTKMFIRIKRIKKKDKAYSYAYIVANRWMKRSRRSKQKVKKYLGRVYSLDKLKNNDFFKFYSIADVKDYVKNNSKKKIINELIRFELINHGFKEQDELLVNENIYFNKKDNELFVNKDNPNKKIVLAMNEGFLCNETIQKLFSRFEGDEREVGFKLANAFVEAGLKIPEEVFVGIYEKVIS